MWHTPLVELSNNPPTFYNPQYCRVMCSETTHIGAHPRANAQLVGAPGCMDAMRVACCNTEMWDKHSTTIEKNSSTRSNPPLAARYLCGKFTRKRRRHPNWQTMMPQAGASEKRRASCSFPLLGPWGGGNGTCCAVYRKTLCSHAIGKNAASPPFCN